MKKHIDKNLIKKLKADTSQDSSHQVLEKLETKSSINKRHYIKNKKRILKQKRDRAKEIKSLRVAFNCELELLLKHAPSINVNVPRGKIKNERYTFTYQVKLHTKNERSSK